MKENINVAIIGSGPAGLTAGIYTARAGLNPVIFTGPNPGGQLMQTTLVENYPGFENGVLGPKLMQSMMKQAENVGANLKFESIEKVDFSSRPFKIFVGDKTYLSKSVIIATGAVPRRIGLESEERFWGKGVSSCATCDGAFYKDKIVAVIGGGNVAFEDAIYLTTHAKKVYLIHRRDEFRAEKVMIEKAKKNDKLEIITPFNLKEIRGKEKVEEIEIINALDKSVKTLKVDGVFIAIGYLPKTDLFKGQVELDEKGYIKKYENSMTNVEGVFVAGDAEDFKYRQAITAAGDGCRAALDLQHWLEKQN